VERLLEASARGDAPAAMSLVNAGEVFYVLVKESGAGAGEAFRRRLPTLPVAVLDPDAALVWEAAGLKAMHRLSYADAFAVALARRHRIPVATGDPEILALRTLEVVDVVALRRGPA
jgi:ribonuclease VapC